MSPDTPAAETPIAAAQPPGLTWPKFRAWAMRRLVVLLVLLTLYVLSIGPMWWAWYSGMYVSTVADYWIIAFYEPLRLACQIEWIDSLVTGYIEWWNL